MWRVYITKIKWNILTPCVAITECSNSTYKKDRETWKEKQINSVRCMLKIHRHFQCDLKLSYIVDHQKKKKLIRWEFWVDYKVESRVGICLPTQTTNALTETILELLSPLKVCKSGQLQLRFAGATHHPAPWQAALHTLHEHLAHSFKVRVRE